MGTSTNKEGGHGSSATAEVNGFALPTFDPSPVSQETPPKLHEVDGGSDSSNWSSSDEEEEGVGDGGGGRGEVVKPVKPSTHSSLIAEWEWRAMNQDTPTSRYCCELISVLTSLSLSLLFPFLPLLVP